MAMIKFYAFLLSTARANSYLCRNTQFVTMIQTKDIRSQVKQLIVDRHPFALYRLPAKHNQHLVVCEGEVTLMDDLRMLNQKRGFVIAPFRVDEQHPVVVMEHYSELVVEEDWSESYTHLPRTEIQPLTESYAHRFTIFHRELEEGRFEKLVLSRSEDLTIGFDPLKVYCRAMAAYPNAYVWMGYTPQTGLWVGATPEVILVGRDDEWSVMALAGTQAVEESTEPLAWDAKNLREQAYVSEYLLGQLQSVGIEPHNTGTYTIRAGGLAHLKTDFRFRMSDHEHLGDLLQLLHPTPAVCGLPKDEAYRFIIEKEGYTRGYYSGFVGRLDPQCGCDLYVNLRCMQATDKGVRLYAGGGLLPSSRMQEEWAETEHKLQTMKRVLI